MTSEFVSDPVERTRFHEAGHTLVYWRLFAIIAPTILATHAINDYGDIGTMGWMRFDDLKNGQAGYQDFLDSIAVFYGGKIAIRLAVERGLLEDLRQKDPREIDLGDIGFLRPPGLSNVVYKPPYTDSEHVEALATECMNTLIKHNVKESYHTLEHIKIESMDLALAVIDEHWDALARLVTELRQNHGMSRLQIRDALVL